MSIRIYIGNLPQGFNPKEFDKVLKSVSETVRFRNVDGSPGALAFTVFENASGFSITSVTTNTYTFELGSTPTLSGNFGGDFVTAGPVTQQA